MVAINSQVVNSPAESSTPAAAAISAFPAPDQLTQWRATVVKKVKRQTMLVQRQYLEQADNWQLLDLQREQLFHLIALNFHQIGDWQAVIDSVLRGDEYMQRRGAWERWGELLTLALQAARFLADPLAEAEISFRLGSLRFRQGLFQTASAELTSAERLYRAVGATDQLPKIWICFAENQIAQGHYRAATDNLSRAEQHQQTMRDAQLWINFCCARGLFANRQGDAQNAITWYTKALTLPEPNVAVSSEVRNSLGTAHQRLGSLYCERGAYEDALTHLAAAHKIVAANGNDSAMSRILSLTGTVWGLRGQLYRSIDYFQQACAVAERCGYLGMSLSGHSNLAVSYYRLGELTTALREVRIATHLATRLEYRPTWLNSLINECEILCALAQPNGAQAALRAAETLWLEMDGTPELAAFLAGAQGRVAALLGDGATAIQRFLAAIAEMQTTQNRFEMAEFAIELVPLYLAQCVWDEAAAWVDTVRTIGQELQQSELSGQAEMLAGDLARLQGDVAGARLLYQAAQAAFDAQAHDRNRYLAARLAKRRQALG